ncbi:MAG: acyloxyacyl hydrolase, partial [Bacteroidia bacterium]
MITQTAQKYRKLFSLALFILCFSQASFSQLAVYPTAFGLRYHYGFIIQHKQDMDQLVTGHVPAYEIYYRYNFSGVKEWEKFFNYPHAGAALQWLNFNNSKLGSAWSLIPYVSFPLSKSRVVDLHLRSGFGLAYHTNVFNLDDNRKNGVIGTRINAAIQFLLQ